MTVHLIDPHDNLIVCDADLGTDVATNVVDNVDCEQCLSEWFGINPGEDA